MKKFLFRVSAFMLTLLPAMALTSCNNDSFDLPEVEEAVEANDFVDCPPYRVISAEEFTAQEIADMIYNPAGSRATDGLDDETRALRLEMRQRFLEADEQAYVDYEQNESPKTGIHRSSIITTYDKIVIEYTSKDHNGQPITLSGLLTYQHWRSILWLVQPKRSVDKVLIENHYTITSDQECPTKSGSVLEGGAYTFPGIVVSADYQGYGSSANNFHPYLNQEVTARQQVDFLKVALNYVRNNEECKKVLNVADQLHTYNLGYSQGGAVTVAVQKYLEQHERALMKTIDFRGSIAGDGPYNLTNTFNFYRETGVVNMPIVLPLIVQGMMNSYPELFEGIHINEYFNYTFLHANWWSNNTTYNKYTNIIEMMNTKLYTTGDFDDMFAEAIPERKAEFKGNAKYNFDFKGYDISLLLSPAAMDTNSNISKALIAAFEKNNVLNGWTPTYPVYFYHCVKDPVVPYVNLKNQPWSRDVYTIDERTFFENHTYGGYKFYVDLIFSSNIESYFGFFNLERGTPVIGDITNPL